LVIDRSVAGTHLAESVEAAVCAGVDWLQVRDRELGDRALLELCDTLGAAARRGAARRRGRVRVIVNRRIDLALSSGADGVHLGFDAVDPPTARQLLGERMLIGASTHATEEVDAAAGLSYAQLAPIFPPRSKAGSRPPLGLAALRAASQRGLPVLAQGGIDADNAHAVLRAGAAGVAVTGAILQAENPGAATRALREALDG